MGEIIGKPGDALGWLGRLISKYLSRGWPALAVLAALAFGAASVSLAGAGLQLRSSGVAGLAELRSMVGGNLTSDGANRLLEAESKVISLADELTPSLQAARWSGRLMASAAWMPIVSMEGRGLYVQAERVDNDLQDAAALLRWMDGFLSAYEDAQETLGSLAGEDTMDGFRTRLTAMEAGLLRADGAPLATGRPPAIFTLARHVEPFSNRMDDIEEAEWAMADAADAGRHALRLMGALLDLAEASGPMLSLLQGDPSDETLNETDEIYMTLERFDTRAASAKEAASAARVSLSKLEFMGPFLSRFESLEGLIGALADIGEAGVLGFEAIRPAHQLMKESDAGLLEGEGVLLDALAALGENRDDLLSAADQLADARADLVALTKHGALSPGAANLPAVLEFVAQVEGGLRMVHGITPLATTVLGGDEPKRLLLLGQSSDELRGTGGFVSALWTLEFETGSLEGVTYYDAVRVDDWDRILLYPKAPEGIEEHMNAWVWLLRDVSWDPDFSSTAQSAKAMFKIGQNREVDGVVAINQWALLSLLRAVGEVVPPEGGDTITPNNLISALEQGTDLYGRAYSDLVLQGVLQKLETKTSPADLVRLAAAVYGAMEARDILIYFDDAGAQSGAESLGWAGRVLDQRGDYLYVVDSNVGWSKVDRNIERRVAYSVDLNPVARPRARLELQYVNHSGPGSAPCEPQDQNRGRDYNQLVNACYWDYLRVYFPSGSRILRYEALPLPELSVSAGVGIGTPGQPTGALSASHGKMIFSGLSVVPAGETQEAVLVYDLPAEAVAAEGDSLDYVLTVQKQPGVRQRAFSLNLTPPDGYRVQSSSMPYTTSGDDVSISFVSSRDETIRVTFAKDAP